MFDEEGWGGSSSQQRRQYESQTEYGQALERAFRVVKTRIIFPAD